MFYPAIYFGAMVGTFALTVLISHFLIPVLASHKMGQKILEIGPRWHKNKEGTPTMGGIAFIIASVLVGILLCIFIGVNEGFRKTAPLMLTLAMAVASGLVGVIDDRAKLKKKQNEGLSAAQKLLLQLLCSGIYVFGMAYYGGMSTELFIPFFGVSVDFGIWYYILSVVLIAGIMNSVNLADGIDGLASSETAVVAVFYAIAASFAYNTVNVGALSMSALLLGSALGFLVYNFYPARVFMGDTGSLFLGGLVVGTAFMLGNPLIVIICGLMYIAETVSDVLQVGYFKLTGGKRLFKMAPIHHHFEKCGWSEIKIVTVFSLLTAAFCVLAWFGL